MKPKLRPQYYALRRFCPYQGVVQVVEVGNARAYSEDGQHWTVRIERSYTRYDACSEHDEDTPVATANDLMEAINNHPGIPFPLEDRVELWLLHKETQLPLALIKSRRHLEDADAVTDPTWHPFLGSNTDFKSPTLDEKRKQTRSTARAQDVLEREINMAARPRPKLQWFARASNGSGVGHSGMRVDEALLGRQLAVDDFPELLVREDWADDTRRELVREYHEWYAPSLLAHQNIRNETRAWLENAARRRPDVILKHYPMYPEVLDEEAMQVSLVSGRLMARL